MTGVRTRLQRALASRYTIDAELGRGGMSIVFRALDTKHSRTVAVKVLRPELASSVASDRFLREISIASSLQHPHILPLLDSGSDGDLVYYVMPFVEGESLRQRLHHRGPLDVDEALAIVGDVAQGLEHAHSHGIVHRDIKPENILLAQDFAVVADFGVARAYVEAGGEEVTSAGVAIGTPQYMSPEQAGANEHLDGRSDIYSLGCVLFEMLTGEPPFMGKTAQSVLAKQMQERVPSIEVVRPGLPSGIVDALDRSLAKVPADRFATVTDFVDALRAGRDTLAMPRRRVSRLGVVGAFVLTVVAIAMVGLFSSSTMTPGAVRDPMHLAVLYFNDLTDGHVLEHVASGITHDIIDRLNGVEPLRIISAEGVRSYRDRPVSLDTIVARLNVGTVVTGTVDSTAGTLDVKVRVIDALTNSQTHNRTFRIDYDRVHEVGAAVAQDVSDFLRRTIGQEVRLLRLSMEAPNAAAWNLVQRAEVLEEDARVLYRMGDPAAAFATLLQADSLFAEAHDAGARWPEPLLRRGWLRLQLADAASTMRHLQPSLANDLAALTLEDWLRDGLRYAQALWTSDSMLAQTRELRGALLHLLSLELEGEEAADLAAQAERDLRSAAAQDPSLTRAWYYLSYLLQLRGRFAEAGLAASKALEADAFLHEAPDLVQNLMIASLEMAQFDSAAQLCATGRRRFPDDPRFGACEFTIVGWSGTSLSDVDHAWRLLNEIEASDSLGQYRGTRAFRRAMIAGILARAGARDSAEAVLDAARTQALADDSKDFDYYAAYVRMLLGEDTTALRLLGDYLRRYPAMADYVSRNHWFEPLRAGGRFDSVVNSLHEN